MIADVDTWINVLGLVLVAIITAGGTVFAAVIARKANVVEAKVDANTDALDTVHGLVNDQLDTVMSKNVALVEDLRVAKTQPAET